jgi:ribosomal protein S18 acetylase RimI-like enzyme
MVTVEPATHDDIARLVELEAGLFREDAGRHERFADVTWPEREGHDDFEQLLANPFGLVLVARAGSTVVGHAVGYLSQSSPTRVPVRFGVLRSMFVDVGFRDEGVGSQLVEAFISWASVQGCAEAQVDSYIANEGAQRFYARHGFEAVSVSRALLL